MPKKRTLHVLVLCGGPSSEHEVSLNTGAMVFKNIDRKQYAPQLAVIQKDGKWKFGNEKVLDIGAALARIRSRFDFVFIAMHGAFGEDGRIQALLEWVGVPYGGSGVASSAMAMDKNVSNILYAANGLRVPRYAVLHKNIMKGKLNLPVPLPFVVKPRNGGSSVGVSIVTEKAAIKKALAAAFREETEAMVQEYIKGREFTCGVVEGKSGRPFALPPTEIVPRVSGFFDYKAKYEPGGSDEITPPKLPKSKIKELQRMALVAHEALGCRGMSRSDFIMRGSTFYILETNTIPGMTQTSLLPQAARVAGISFSELLHLIIQAGLRAKSERV